MIRVLLVGYGAFGRVYARRVLEHPDFELVGIVENGENTEDARRVGVLLWRDLGRALSDTTTDLVLIAASETAHDELCAVAIGRGYDVMVAKPGATSLSAAVSLKQLAESTGARLVVDWTPLHMTGWARVCEFAAEIGVVQTVRFTRRGWSTPRACGALWDLAPHDVALAINLNPADEIVDVTAAAWGTGIHLTMRHESAKVSRVECDYTSTHRERSVEVVGTCGTVEWLADEPTVVSSVRDDAVLVPDMPDAITKHLGRVARVLRGDEADNKDMLVSVCRVLDAAEHDLRARESLRAQICSLAVAA